MQSPSTHAHSTTGERTLAFGSLHWRFPAGANPEDSSVRLKIPQPQPRPRDSVCTPPEAGLVEMTILSFAFCNSYHRSAMRVSVFQREGSTVTLNRLCNSHSIFLQDSNMGSLEEGSPGKENSPKQHRLTLAWSFVMSGLRSERLKS